jgi:hypothetical protein
MIPQAGHDAYNSHAVTIKIILFKEFDRKIEHVVGNGYAICHCLRSWGSGTFSDTAGALTMLESANYGRPMADVG